MTQLTLKTEGDRYVVATRRFAASPEAVYRAHTDPAIIQQWMLGPDGWTMPVCVNEARPGGKIRYEWSDGKGNGFYLTGEFVAGIRIQHGAHRGLAGHVAVLHASHPIAEDGQKTPVGQKIAVAGVRETKGILLVAARSDVLRMSGQIAHRKRLL